MPTLQIVSNYSNNAANSIETAYTAPTGKNVSIEALTAVNTSGVNASYKAYIVSASGIEQPQIPFTVVIWGDSDLGIGAVNQVIPAGGALRFETSAVDSIYFTVTGREIDT